jgi:tyrosyl-tRNA synthetase
VQACVDVGFAKSNGEARRSIQGAGIRVNDVAVTDEKLELTSSMLNADGVIKLSMGKKKHVLVSPA